MSELVRKENAKPSLRRHLLTNVSMIALLGVVCAANESLAASSENNQPTIWIELGGQLERADSQQTIFAPGFLNQTPDVFRAPMIDSQRPSRYTNGAEGKITLAPQGLDWVLSAAVRYGRSDNARHLHYQSDYPTPVASFLGNLSYKTQHRSKFGDGQTHSRETHFILDFQAGKDVGLGMFGINSTGVISGGVRFAQFTSTANVTLHDRPVLGYNHYTGLLYGIFPYRIQNPFRMTYSATMNTARNSHGIGPSLSWDASLPVLGDEQSMRIAFDYGLNGAVLFGRQRTHVDHQTAGQSYSRTVVNLQFGYHTGHYTKPVVVGNRSRSVVIPNVGGFAGVSVRYDDAMLKLGYRADFFFNAIDNGIDTSKSRTLGFYGPFATISIGLGG